MIDWTKQTEEMTKSWFDTQKKLWDNWLGAGQKDAEGQAVEMWNKTIVTWEEAVKNMLNVQKEWTRLWADNFKTVEGMPKEAIEWLQQAQEMSKQWGEAQHQLWDSWFALLKKVEPSQVQLTGDFGEESQKMFKTWQEATQKVMGAQAEWAKTWTVWPAGDKFKDFGDKVKEKSERVVQHAKG
jgi:hypothetical protein